MDESQFLEKVKQTNIIWVDCSEEGHIKHVSENIQPVFSKPAGFYTGKKVRQLLPANTFKEVSMQCRQLRSKGGSCSFFLSVPHEESFREFSVQLNYNPETGYFAAMTPLSTRGNYFEEKSFRQLEVMRTTLESMDDFVFVLDKNNRFSELYNQHNNFSQKDFPQTFKVGSPLSDAGFPEDVVSIYLTAISKCRLAGTKQQINYSIKAFGGKLFYQANMSPRFTFDNKFDGVTVVLRDVSAIQKSQEKLKESLDYYLTVLFNLPNPIWRVNAFKKFDYFNKKWVEFTGIEVEKHSGSGWRKGIHPKDRQKVVNEFESRFADKKPFSFEYRLIHNSGKYRWVKNFCQPLFDLKGRFTGYMGSCFDVDDIRTTQKLLRESESRYRTMVEEQSDLVLRWNVDCSITFANSSFCSFFRKGQEELIGKNWLQLIGSDNIEHLTTKIKEFVSCRKSGFIETQIQSYDNEPVVFQWLNSPISNKKGEIIEFQSVGRDITDITEKEKENQTLVIKLNEKLKELSLLNKISQYINEEVGEHQLYRFLVNDIPKSFLYPDKTYAHIEYAGMSYYSNNFQIPAESRVVSFSFRNQHEGLIKVYREKKTFHNPAFDYIEDNENDLLITVCEMISSYLLRLETDNKLSQSEMRYTELFENVPDIVFTIDKKGEILKINPAATKILGYESFEGKRLWDLAAPSDRKENLNILRRVISLKQRFFTFETKVLSEAGDMVFLQIGGIIKYTANGEPQEIFGIARDITEQKRLEQSLMKTVIHTEEKERKRFAEDLHDGIGPLLSGLKMYLQQETLEKGLGEKQQKVLRYCRELVDDAINQTRSIANNLTPGILNDFGLAKALLSHVNKINAIGKFVIQLNIKSSLETLENDISIAVFRIVSELINNALKHADCNLIEVTIDIKKNILSLLYLDDGKGFEINEPGRGKATTKMGLKNIGNRVHSLNGSFTLSSKKGKGVFVKIYIPLK